MKKPGFLMVSSIILLGTTLFASCEKEEDNKVTPKKPTVNEQAGRDALGIRAINTGTGDFEVAKSGNGTGSYIKYCYDDNTCKTHNSSVSYSWIAENNSRVIAFSADSIYAEGLSAHVKIESGEGYFEVVRGDRIAEFMIDDFETDEVVFTTDTFYGGYATFSYGDTLP